MVEINTDGFKRIQKRVEEKAEQAKKEIHEQCERIKREMEFRHTIMELEMRIERLERHAGFPEKKKDSDTGDKQEKKKTPALTP